MLQKYILILLGIYFLDEITLKIICILIKLDYIAPVFTLTTRSLSF